MEISHSRAATDVRHRINVPNSIPRSIKFVGIGEGGAQMAANVAEQHLRNVEVIAPIINRSESDAASPGKSSSVLQAITAEENEITKAFQGANMVFLVAISNDDISLAPVISGIARSTGVLVTGIMIQKEISNGETAKSGLEILRAASDMLVITSDESYVIEMLGALGA
jgi:cell division GTPase FtsZ